MRIVAISDTHARHRAIPDVPAGDVLVHAGDLTSVGKPEHVQEFNTWLGELPHPHKVVIAGNHDFPFERAPASVEPLLTNCVYLRDSAIVIEGVTFYGSPWQPAFMDWAFNPERGEELRKKWELIPDGTDVLITHGPPAGHGDTTTRGACVGCVDLMEAVLRVKPRLHIFGHIHEGAGVTEADGTRFANASSVTERYEPTNPAIVIDLEI